MNLAPAIGGLAAAFLLAGCASGVPAAGGASTPAAGASAPGAAGASADAPAIANEACGLITEADVTAALGSDPGAGEASGQPGATACTFGAYPATVMIHLVTGGQAAYDKLHDAPSDGEIVDLDGIGDAAFGVFNGPVASVAFYSGDEYVSLVVYADGNRDHAIALAKTAASHL